MIKNQRQYNITNARAEEFERVLAQLIEQKPGPDVHPRLWQAQQDAVRSQMNELRAQLAEYDALRSGERKILEVESFDALPRALIQARIAAGLSQKELAERLGLKEQQVQQYEASEYASASLARISEVVNALGIHIRKDVFLPAAHVSEARLFQRLREVHIDRDLIVKRLLPASLVARLEQDAGNVKDNAVMQAAAIIGRVFNLRLVDVFGTSHLRLDTAVAGVTRYKTPANANEKRVSAYTVYAHYLALLTLQATRHLPQKPIPTDYHEVHDAIVTTYGAMTFENALRYIWSLGIPVLPLSDSGNFHGACWRDNGRNVIVLKQGTRYPARWLNDVIHELFHCSQEPDSPNFALIEKDEMTSEQQNSQEEKKARRFASLVMLNGRADELARLCVEQANGNTRNLKTAVQRVAAQEDIPADQLANHLAFRLAASNGESWWATADTFQAKNVDAWEIARSHFRAQLNLTMLNDVDRNLLLQALSNTTVGD